MEDDRGNLALEYLRLADRLRPRWLVWENVPGVLSSNRGRDFGSFLGGLGELGYGWAYRVLDAQYYGVAQRRRRVFVVAHAGGSWQRAAAVLFERHSLRGDPPPRREAGEGVVAFSPGSLGDYREGAGRLRAQGGDAGGGSEVLIAADIAHTLRGEGHDASEDGTGRGTPLVCETLRSHPRPGSNTTGPLVCVNARQDPTTDIDLAGALGAQDTGHAVFDPNQITSKANRSVPTNELCHTLPAATTPPVSFGAPGVRRLTPRECERLQGFPDDFTLVPHNGKPAKDTPRYKAIGNSMAVPVMRWIGERIAMVDAL